MTLSHGEIRALVGDCDDEQMAKYRKVAIEQVASIMAGENGPCPSYDHGCLPCVRDDNGAADCRRCWREYLEGEGR